MEYRAIMTKMNSFDHPEILSDFPACFIMEAMALNGYEEVESRFNEFQWSSARAR